MEYLQPIITILSLIGACLAWIAKLRWSKEFEQAKNAVIQSKDAEIAQLKSQIEMLGELNSVKLRESYLRMKEQLEEYIDELKSDLSAAEAKLAEADQPLEKAEKLQALRELSDEKKSLLSVKVGGKEPDFEKLWEVARRVAITTSKISGAL